MIICFGVVPFVFTSPRNLPGVSAYFRNLGKELAGGARKELQEGSIARRNQQHPMKLKKLHFDGHRDALPCRLGGCKRHDARSDHTSVSCSGTITELKPGWKLAHWQLASREKPHAAAR
jgi:hypothetical protein